MKITKSQLKQIIKEELDNVIDETISLTESNWLTVDRNERDVQELKAYVSRLNTRIFEIETRLIKIETES